ncbi:N-acetyltransferase [Pseudomonas sp. PB103]|uniref:GNAT family N-acetyltransferase n=1 Tax=Pseudomonas sp. PB103 TaxID=2494698 RepID=UPI00131CCEFD|nr:GNAT family N-acetyltransferase [Pseudomonas sp. PB103]KAE9647783.1 N-acetyltransferase [Pseudomonas sp. PB103]
MAVIERYTSSPSPEIYDQIIEITMEYASELSLEGIAANNPLHSVLQCSLGLEVAIYLSRMDESSESKTELVVALDENDRSKVVGYNLYLPLRSASDACGICYMAVLESHRNQGVGGAMMHEVLAHYPHAELSCFIEKVPFYQKFGFELIGTRETQVRLNTRGKSADDFMSHIIAGRLAENPVVIEQYNAQLALSGKLAMDHGQREHARQFAQLKLRAIAYVQEHGVTA